MNSEIEIILRKMCEFVDADYDKIDFKDHKWYLSHEWTVEQETKFQEWLLDYLKKLPIKSFRKLYNSGKYELEKNVKWFTFQYGWKYVS